MPKINTENVRKQLVVDAVKTWGLDYHTGNAISHIAHSAGENGEFNLDNLRAAVDHLNHKINEVETDTKRAYYRKVKKQARVKGGKLSVTEMKVSTATDIPATKEKV